MKHTSLIVGGVCSFGTILTGCTMTETVNIGDVGSGGACAATYECQAGLLCSGGICTGFGRSEYEIFKSASCSDNSDCCSDIDADGTCRNSSGLYCGTQLRCVNSPGGQVGDSCSLDVDCVNGLICNGDTSLCEHLVVGTMGTKDLGEACDNANDCRRPYICSTVTADQTCVKLPFFSGVDCTLSDKEAGEFRIYYEIPAFITQSSSNSEFYRHPFPSDLRVTNEGTIYLDDHPSPGNALGIDVAGQYIKATKETVKGYALNQPIFFRSTDILKKSTLCLDDGGIYPELADGDSDSYCSNGGSASVYLVNVDTNSANYGKHIPVELKWEKNASQFICQNWLAIAPLTGRPLEPKTTYAAVITTDIRDNTNTKPIQDEAFYNTLHKTDSTTNPKVASVLAPFINWANQEGLDLDSFAAATVFTTGDPTELGERLYQTLQQLPSAYFNKDSVLCENTSIEHFCHGGVAARQCSSEKANFYEIHGSYTAPAFQEGTRPYTLEGGNFAYDAAGNPAKVADETMCYALSIPKSADLSQKLPVLIYAHGTGGNFKSFINDSLVDIYTSLGFAVISFDNVMHGPRQDPSFEHNQWNPLLWSDEKTENLFFNTVNPQAARYNILQGGADLFSLVNLIKNAPMQSTGDLSYSFDPNNIFYLGHSQGTTINGPFLAYDTMTKGAVLSGAGAELTVSVLKKSKPQDIGTTLNNLFGDNNLTRIHPIMGIMDMLFAEVDTLSYANKFIITEVRKNIPRPTLMYYGLDDSYSPNDAQESQIKAMGIPMLGPNVRPVNGVSTVTGTVTSVTLEGKTINVPAAAVQYAPVGDNDGHFVLFDDSNAQYVLKHFLESTLAGTPEIKR